MIDAPRERVFEAIHRAADYPRWWRGVESVPELEPGDADGVGSLARDTWKSRLPYRLEFDVRVTSVVRPHLLAGEATGDLAGDGTWRSTKALPAPPRRSPGTCAPRGRG